MARVKISVEGYKDRVRRPRWIVWTVVVVIVIVGVMIPVLGITSTRWFCSQGCHKVQDDTITAYQHSSHSEISCMACHMPVNANPVIFLIHKAEALGELAQTVTNNFELPLNAESEVALTMKSAQCTQCHNENKRRVTPGPGLKIDHEAHAVNEVQCTICHNRVGHKEDFQPKLVDPKTGKTNTKHVNFMEMTACFRCHTQEPKPNTPTGECFICHTKDFQLFPESHLDPGFFPKGHGQLAAEEESRAPWTTLTTTQTVEAAAHPVSDKERYAGENLPKVESINLCSTCHSKAFCTDCHGTPMPHAADFKKTHGDFGLANPQVCRKCHGLNDSNFCGTCHHGQTLNYQIVPKVTWIKQHPLAVNSVGAAGCIQPLGCHSPTYCAICHANGGTLPKGAPPF